MDSNDIYYMIFLDGKLSSSNNTCYKFKSKSEKIIKLQEINKNSIANHKPRFCTYKKKNWQNKIDL